MCKLKLSNVWDGYEHLNVFIDYLCTYPIYLMFKYKHYNWGICLLRFSINMQIKTAKLTWSVICPWTAVFTVKLNVLF